MKIEIRKSHPYKGVVVIADNISLDLGLHTDEESKNLAATLRDAADDLDKSDNYSKDTSDKIQNDIIACIDGFLEADTIYRTDLDNMKSALCQILVDNRK